MSLELPRIDALLASVLAEDLGVPSERVLGAVTGSEILERDVTSWSIVPAGSTFAGVIVARQGGVVCGLPVAEQLYAMLSRTAGSPRPVELYPLVAEGARAAAGTPVIEIEGPARVVLAGERSALNLLMTLSGIATQASLWQEAAGPELAVVDTRKTLPGLRALSKYAVRVGGAHNHRMGLFDMVLVKDNHIRHAGGIANAVRAAREAQPGLAIEVEADTVAQAAEAAGAGADIVLLDNMDDATLATAVAVVREASSAGGHVTLTEASGGIRYERVAVLREIGIDRVSSSAISLASPLDFGLDEVNP